jgi:hypothetical protein
VNYVNERTARHRRDWAALVARAHFCGAVSGGKSFSRAPIRVSAVAAPVPEAPVPHLALPQRPLRRP